jgi:hypothetical protein
VKNRSLIFYEAIKLESDLCFYLPSFLRLQQIRPLQDKGGGSGVWSGLASVYFWIGQQAVKCLPELQNRR